MIGFPALKPPLGEAVPAMGPIVWARPWPRVAPDYLMHKRAPGPGSFPVHLTASYQSTKHLDRSKFSRMHILDQPPHPGQGPSTLVAHHPVLAVQETSPLSWSWKRQHGRRRTWLHLRAFGHWEWGRGQKASGLDCPSAEGEGVLTCRARSEFGRGVPIRSPSDGTLKHALPPVAGWADAFLGNANRGAEAESVSEKLPSENQHRWGWLETRCDVLSCEARSAVELFG
ncbi:hypothetical protein PAPYR_11135 [Paratrimastix pyriformis]|uniref:Uncharacterized protein n=1 Tax=Paratrimastix pyriformis TaxID=342808 RepID=A0ABQ8UA73_9EUKA|nr:hypothetical protein PAPYR_11135 [Paratrimastix pyriformis]